MSLLLFILLALFIRLLMLAVTTKVSIEFQEIFWTVFILTMWWWRLYQLARLSCFFNLSVKILFISLWFVSVLCSADTMLLCIAVRRLYIRKTNIKLNFFHISKQEKYDKTSKINGLLLETVKCKIFQNNHIWSSLIYMLDIFCDYWTVKIKSLNSMQKRNQFVTTDHSI